MEMTRHENDKQIAVVYFTMVRSNIFPFVAANTTQSSMLFLLTDLDPLFEEEEYLHNALQERMKLVCDTINDFGTQSISI